MLQSLRLSDPVLAAAVASRMRRYLMGDIRQSTDSKLPQLDLMPDIGRDGGYYLPYAGTYDGH